MDILIKIAQLVLCLSILVMVHELGHFMFAKIFGARVEKFYLFFNPYFSLFKKKIGETVYGIGWVPFGGYVKIAGMIDESMDTEQMKQEPQPWEFRSKPAWQRLLIMVGGVMMNLVLALVIYIAMSYHYGESYIAASDVKNGYSFSELGHDIGFVDGDVITTVDGKSFDNYLDIMSQIRVSGTSEVEVLRDGEPVVVSVTEEFTPRLLSGREPLFSLRIPFTVDSVLVGSAAAHAGLVAGDSLVSVNGEPMSFRDQFVTAFRSSAGDTLRLGILRDSSGVMHSMTLPLAVPDSGVIGTISTTDILSYYPLTERRFSFWQAIPNGFKRAVDQVDNYIKQLKLVVNPDTEAYKSVGSVVSMGRFFPPEWDWYRFWNITALFSIMLAVLNILPIPALDGGHVVFLLYEVITRRKPSDKFMMGAQTVGMILLFLLIIFTLGNDIIKLILGR